MPDTQWYGAVDHRYVGKKIDYRQKLLVFAGYRPDREFLTVYGLVHQPTPSSEENKAMIVKRLAQKCFDKAVVFYILLNMALLFSKTWAYFLFAVAKVTHLSNLQGTCQCKYHKMIFRPE